MRISILSCCLISLIACGGGGGDDSSSDAPQNLNACGELNSSEKSYPKIIGGEVCAIDLSTAVVRIAGEFSGPEGVGIAPFCTGSFVTQNSILTAAHCFLDPSLPGYELQSYGIVIGTPGNFQFYRASGVEIAPGFTESLVSGGERLFNDLAILKLPANLPVNILPILASRPAASSETGLVYGYGLESTDENASADFIDLKGGSMLVKDVTPNHIFVRYSGNGTNVCFGDSGGPILLNTATGYAIAGVVSQGSNTTCEEGDVTTYTNIAQSSLSAWLQNVLQGEVQL